MIQVDALILTRNLYTSGECNRCIIICTPQNATSKSNVDFRLIIAATRSAFPNTNRSVTAIAGISAMIVDKLLYDTAILP